MSHQSFLTVFQNSTNSAHQKHTRKIKNYFLFKVRTICFMTCFMCTRRTGTNSSSQKLKKTPVLYTFYPPDSSDDPTQATSLLKPAMKVTSINVFSLTSPYKIRKPKNTNQLPNRRGRDMRESFQCRCLYLFHG